jgi:hypothetical protein
MNYYIQGCAAKADKIKAAFKRLGIKTGGYDFSRKDVLFFTFEAKGKTYMMSSLLGTGLDNIILTHPNYKELELPVEPKFKVGDEIKTGNTIETIAEVDHAARRYYCESGRTISFVNQDLWKLDTKPHYDIANFHVGMPVLVRPDNDCKWDYSIFSRNVDNEYWHFAVCNGVSFTQCIPFNEDTKHLLGTTDMCDDRFINW